jgi:hypothetical protein
MEARALLVAVCLALTGCDGPPPVEEGPEEPAYPGAEVLRSTATSSTPLYPSAGESRCPVLITVYGSDDPIEDVVAFFEGEGFVSSGEELVEEGALVGWVGIRDGDDRTWRSVNIASGDRFAVPERATVWRLGAPDCEDAGPPPAGHPS